jgi:hypothetical protein
MMKGTDTAMDLETLRHSVENDIKNYRYSSSGNTVGTAWSEERIEAELAAMRAALVSPYWADVELRDTHEQIATEQAILRKCAIVADDLKGTILAFDPIENGFLLAVKQKDALLTIGVRGDAVGCFMAR